MTRVERFVRRQVIKWQIRDVQGDIRSARQVLPTIDSDNLRASQERYIDMLHDEWTVLRREKDAL